MTSPSLPTTIIAELVGGPYDGATGPVGADARKLLTAWPLDSAPTPNTFRTVESGKGPLMAPEMRGERLPMDASHQKIVVYRRYKVAASGNVLFLYEGLEKHLA